MKSGKTIVLLTPGFAKDESDTSCIPLLQDFVKELKCQRPGWRIFIIALQYPPIRKEYLWNGIRLFSIGGNDSKLSRLFVWRRAWEYLKLIHRSEKIDFLHSFWLSETTFLAQRFSNRFAIPHIATALGQDVKSSNRYLFFLDFHKMITVTISEWQRKFLSERKIESGCIPFGVNPESFSRDNQERTIDILGAGSLTKLKNYELFVSVVADAKKRFPGITALLIGDGPERTRLEELRKNSGLENNLHFSGGIKREEGLNYMQQAKIFLHTSTFEGEGFVLLEALASGCRVISSDVGIAPQIGKVSVCTNTEEMVNAVSQAMTETFNAERSFPFTIQETIARYLHLYNQPEA